MQSKPVGPSRANYEPLAGSERLHDYVTGGRWTGRAAVLWANGAPDEILFWVIRACPLAHYVQSHMPGALRGRGQTALDQRTEGKT